MHRSALPRKAPDSGAVDPLGPRASAARAGRKRRLSTWVACAIATAGITVAALPAVAAAYRGDGVFTLVEGNWLRGRDVTMLPDGSVVGVTYARAWVLTPDGRRTRIPQFGGTGVTAAADGAALALQSDARTTPVDPRPVGRHRVARWTSGVGVSILAGTGARGFGGDGGPATQALLDLEPSTFAYDAYPPAGIAALPGGGFAFADMGNGRIRAVDAAGTIRTVAGGTIGTLRDPSGLAATPDGGYLVTESGWYPDDDDGYLRARVRRVGPDGSIRTLGHWLAEDLVVLPDGTAILANGWLWRVEPDAWNPQIYLAPRRRTQTFDFAARSAFAWRVGLDSSGGLLAVGDSELTYVPRGTTPWTLAALRDTRTSRRAVTAVIETTQPGTATLEISNGRRVVARATAPVTVGHSTLRAFGPIRDEWYDARVRLTGPSGAVADDEVPIHGAQRLTVDLARRLLGRRQGVDVDETTIYYRLGRDCRRFGPRRVDCAITRSMDGRTAVVASVTLARTGIVLRRHYRWGRLGFQRRPRFVVDTDRSDPVLRMSRDRRGWWGWERG